MFYCWTTCPILFSLNYVSTHMPTVVTFLWGVIINATDSSWGHTITVYLKFISHLIYAYTVQAVKSGNVLCKQVYFTVFSNGWLRIICRKIQEFAESLQDWKMQLARFQNSWKVAMFASGFFLSLAFTWRTISSWLIETIILHILCKSCKYQQLLQWLILLS